MESIGSDNNEERLPGQDLISEGLVDLKRGQQSVAALLVLVGAPRLRRLGMRIPTSISPGSDSPEHRLYDLLSERVGPADAHSQYNAYIRRLVSFERALELRQHVLAEDE